MTASVGRVRSVVDGIIVDGKERRANLLSRLVQAAAPRVQGVLVDIGAVANIIAVREARDALCTHDSVASVDQRVYHLRNIWSPMATCRGSVVVEGYQLDLQHWSCIHGVISAAQASSECWKGSMFVSNG